MSNSQTKKELFINQLLSGGIIKEDDRAGFEVFDEAFEIYKKLISQGKDIIGLSKLYADLYGVPFIERYEIDSKADSVLDHAIALKFGFFPFMLDENTNTLKVAIHDAEKLSKLDPQSLGLLSGKIGFRLEIYFSPDYDLQVKENLNAQDKIFLKIPYAIAKKYQILALDMSDDGIMTVGAVNPMDENLNRILTTISQKSGLSFKFQKITEQEFEDGIKKYDQISEEKSDAVLETQGDQAMEAVKSLEEKDVGKFLQKKEVGIDDLKRYAVTGEIPELIASMLAVAMSEGASDIHIEPFEKALRIRFRIDGILRDKLVLAENMQSAIVTRIKVMSSLKIDEKRIPQDGRFDFKFADKFIDVRVSTIPTVFGEKVALRLLDKESLILDFQKLGLDGAPSDRLMKALQKPYGIILSTGPTGSGKSTTLYSIITRLNKPEINIVTLEDPVEYEIPGVNQTQVKPQIGFDFAEGLRSILRQDPNVIMVGEIRDRQTADLVVQGALTGHVVLSTLHTNNAASAIARFNNLGVEPFLLTSALNAVIGQRLVRRVCPHCRQQVDLPEVVKNQVANELKKINYQGEVKFYKGTGCSQCVDGYKGRIGIFEVLTMNDKLEELALQKAPWQRIFEQAVQDGMITMLQDGLIKALKGLTTVDEVMRVTTES